MFQAQFGFYDTVVAAASQAAALRAWGIRQNLFASGEACITDDPQAVEAAVAHPETPLRRAVGSTDPFTLEPANLPNVPDAPTKAAAKPGPTAKLKPARLPEPPVDRSALDEAESALHQLDDERKAEETEFRRRQDDLDAEREAAQSVYVASRKSAATSVVQAREAYRKAGGET